jgi:hypothetical protein
MHYVGISDDTETAPLLEAGCPMLEDITPEAKVPPNPGKLEIDISMPETAFDSNYVATI